MLVGINVPLK